VAFVFFGWLVVMGLIVSPVIAFLCWLPWKIATPDTAWTQAAFGFWYFLVLLTVIAGWFTPSTQWVADLPSLTTTRQT
jgi:hypothetical protein